MPRAGALAGLRPGEDKIPWGCSEVNLVVAGITATTCLPPLKVWKEGQWLADAYWDPKFDLDPLPTIIQKKLEKEKRAMIEQMRGMNAELA